MRNIFVVTILLLCMTTGRFAVRAQQPQQKGYPMQYAVVNGDTIFFDELPEAVIYTKSKFKTRADFRRKRDYRRYSRLVYNLKRVYPYSQIAKRKLSEFNREYLSYKTDKERKAYAKKIEKDLKSEFEAPLRNLTFSQGRMLIKLIDRETGSTTFALIKEFKGGVSAFMWQSLARLFGANLKSEYDKDGEDKVLEELVLMCENGTFDQLYYSMFAK